MDLKQQEVWETFAVSNKDYKYFLLRMSFSCKHVRPFLSKVAGNSGSCAWSKVYITLLCSIVQLFSSQLFNKLRFDPILMEICWEHVAQLVMFSCKQISNSNFDLSCRGEAWSLLDLNINSPFSAETRMIRPRLSLRSKRHDAVNHNWLLCHIYIRETRNFQSHNNDEIKSLCSVVYRRIPESDHFRGANLPSLSLSLSIAK